jgi:hypothetical protein
VAAQARLHKASLLAQQGRFRESAAVLAGLARTGDSFALASLSGRMAEPSKEELAQGASAPTIPGGFDLLRLAALRGNPAAQLVLVRSYSNGERGCPKDELLARAWSEVAYMCLQDPRWRPYPQIQALEPLLGRLHAGNTLALADAPEQQQAVQTKALRILAAVQAQENELTPTMQAALTTALARNAAFWASQP